jgi:type I restriction enzyme, S subunit
MPSAVSSRGPCIDLPEGWDAAELGGLIALRYGKGLPEDKRRPGAVPVYGSNGIVGWHAEPLTSGPTIIVGRKGSVGAVHLSEQPCWPIDTTYFVDDFGPFDKRVLAYLLRSLKLAELDASTAIPGLSRNDAYAIEIPLPPLPEQRRIVAKVEALLAQVNAARDRLARVPLILKRFRQSVLAAACSGRLTEEWRESGHDSESASALLLRIGAEKKQLLRGQQGRKEFSASSPVDLDFPEEWVLASVDELTSRVTSGSRDWKRYYSHDGPGTFVMAQNVRPLRFDRSFRLAVDPPATDRDRERSEVRQSDILVTIVGANTGDVCRVRDTVDRHYVCQSVALMRPVLTETSPFLELMLNSPAHGRAQYNAWIYGEGRPHLSFDQLKATAIPLPPLPEQHEIVRRVDALFALADTIEKRVAAATARADKLTQAILAKAFRGELVPTEAELARQEGREFESAEALLEPIRGGSPSPYPSSKRGRGRRGTGSKEGFHRAPR